MKDEGPSGGVLLAPEAAPCVWLVCGGVDLVCTVLVALMVRVVGIGDGGGPETAATDALT